MPPPPRDPASGGGRPTTNGASCAGTTIADSSGWPARYSAASSTGGDRERGRVRLGRQRAGRDHGHRERPGHRRMAGGRVDQVVALAVGAESAAVAA